MSLGRLSLVEAAARLRARELSSLELTQACLTRIRALDTEINSFIELTADSALLAAQTADAELRAGRDRGPLQGIPVALKDLIDAAGSRTTAGSAQLAENVAECDAPVTRRLRGAGAVLLGKLNLHEFAYGGSGVISFFGPVKNPANPRHITGGSSSGSAAAVAADFCYAAIGTDTAGSIRLPAACCGVVGFKPSYGGVCTDGVIELSRSYDHVGPLTRTVADSRILWNAIRDHPALESRLSAGSLRLGIVRRYFFDDLNPEVARAVESAIARLRPRYRLKDDVLLEVDPDRAVQMRESWNYHERWVRQAPEKYDSQTLKRIQRGAEISDDEFAAKLKVLQETRAAVPAMFEAAGVDLLITPTTPIPAPAFADVLDEPHSLRARELMLLRNTRPFNVWGTPAISVPCGTTSAGLPIAIQFAAAPGKDDLLLDFAEEFERLPS
jgi:aspartyl-tRNA(Asn)/glutamyl-tRNA(Gln) amidotransferase subunit A